MNKLKDRKFFDQPVIFLPLVLSIGFIIRIYFTPWDLPSPAPDALVYLIEGIQYSKGEIEQFNFRFLWPFLISFLFIFTNFQENIDFLNIMRMFSIILSVSSAGILYFIAKKFFEKKWALIASFLLVIEPHILQNSTFGIKEPLFLVFGLLSIYFVLHKNEKLFPLAFLFAGLSFDTGINGIGVFFTAIIACFIKFKKKSSITKNIIFGILIFLLVSAPHIFFAIENDKIPLIYHVEEFNVILEQQKSSPGTYVSENRDKSNILFVMLEKEILHFGKIMLPYLIILSPIGFILSIKNFNFNRKILIIYTIIPFITAFPIYSLSAEFRNLFFITPILCIWGTVVFEKLNYKKNSKIFIGIILAIVLFSSIMYLENQSFSDKNIQNEKNNFGKYVATNFSGKIMGDFYNEITFNMINPKIGQFEEDDNISNKNLGVVVSEWPLDTEEKLIEFSKQRKINYLIIDDNFDKRYPIFEDIFRNEKDFPYIKKEYDSKNEVDYEIHVKIFKIDLEKIQQ